MGGVEASGSVGTVELVVLHRAMAHDERVDREVERRLGLGGILGGKGIEGKLEVGGGGGVGAIEGEMGGEHLRRGYADAPLDELQEVDSHCQSSRPHHGLAALVVDGGVVDDEAVEKSQIHTSYLDAGVELGGNNRCHARGKRLLDIGYMHHHGNQQIEADHRPETYVEYIFNPLQGVVFSFVTQRLQNDCKCINWLQNYKKMRQKQFFVALIWQLFNFFM